MKFPWFTACNQHAGKSMPTTAFLQCLSILSTRTHIRHPHCQEDKVQIALRCSKAERVTHECAERVTRPTLTSPHMPRATKGESICAHHRVPYTIPTNHYWRKTQLTSAPTTHHTM